MTTERLGKYEVRGTLGKGAMGTVYSAWDPIISRTVAIKTVRLPDAADIDAQEELARFKREAQAAGRLTHPNIVGIFDYGETDEVAYIVMEYVEGRTLKSVLDAEERMPVAGVGRIMADLLAGLRYSHERGVVHRDIKPANIMIVGGDGHGSGQAKIADFGIARIESSNLTQAGTIMGTPAYMSPEQFMGQTVDARTDIYSSGVLLFQLLTGERPFEGSMATIMHKALNTVPPKPSELSVTAPVALDTVVARAMARRPDDRYPDAGAFAAAVAEAVEGRAPAPPPGLGDGLDSDSTVVQTASRPAPPPPRPVAATPPAPPRAKSKTPLLAGMAVIVLAAAGAGGAWWAGLIGTPAPPNPQVAGGAGTVPSSATSGQNTVVAVTPPSTAETTQAAPPVVAATSAPPVPPTPRTDVTQVVPPVTVAADQRPAGASPPAPTQPAQILPAQTPASAPPRTDLAGAPPLEPAHVSPPATAIVPATHVETAQETTPEPARVPPPPAEHVESPAATPPAAVTAALVSPEALRRAVGVVVDGADCAAVHGDLARSGSISLQGVIGSGAPTQDLLRHVRDAAPNATLDWSVEEVAGPYCGALNLIRAYTRPFGSVSGGMDVGLKDGKTDLREDDPIDIRAQTPAFPSYLQIDYFSNDGTVLHVQTAAQGAATFAPRSSHTYVPGQVFEPFGTDLITSIASSVPLFGKGEALSDKTESYLRQLRTALDAAIKRRAELAAGTVVVHTSPKS